MKKAILLSAIALFSAGTFAQTTWKVDKAHAHLTFTVTHLAVSDVDGTFNQFDASIVAAKPDFSDAKFQFTASTASVNTGVDQRDNHLRSADFFNVARYPTVTFASTAIKPAADGHYTLTGNLTMNGITRPVALDLWYRGTIVNPMTKAADAGFQVTGLIRRSDFNFGSKFGSPMLSDEVAFKASGEFGKTN